MRCPQGLYLPVCRAGTLLQTLRVAPPADCRGGRVRAGHCDPKDRSEGPHLCPFRAHRDPIQGACPHPPSLSVTDQKTETWSQQPLREPRSVAGPPDVHGPSMVRKEANPTPSAWPHGSVHAAEGGCGAVPGSTRRNPTKLHCKC